MPRGSSVGWLGWFRAVNRPSRPNVVRNFVITRILRDTAIKSMLRMSLLTAAAISGVRAARQPGDGLAFSAEKIFPEFIHREAGNGRESLRIVLLGDRGADLVVDLGNQLGGKKIAQRNVGEADARGDPLQLRLGREPSQDISRAKRCRLREQCSQIIEAPERSADRTAISHAHLMCVHMRRTIQALAPDQPTRAGLAVTLAIPGFCSTLVHYAVSKIRPGDILVIDRLGDDRHACVGGAVARAAKMAGAVGIVVDGPVTDRVEILAEGLPVWCSGISPITTRRANQGGTFNRPISCGNVPVLPGDIVVADASGVVVLPADEAEQIAREAAARELRVARTMARLEAGEKLGDITRVVQQIENLTAKD